MKGLKRTVWVIAILGGGAYVTLCVAGCAIQKKLIFPGGRMMHHSPAQRGWAFDDVVPEVDGEKTHAWFIPAENARGTVLYSHGNAGAISLYLDWCRFFRELGLNVLIYDYGGYGDSTGGPSEQRCYADVRAMWQYLTEQRGIPPERIVLWGWSLGGGVTTNLAAELADKGQAPVAVVLESTFLSTPDVARRFLPFLPVGHIIQHKFENAKKIGRIHCPVLIIHSPDDDLIPYSHGQELFRLANEPKQFLEIHGPHNGGAAQSEDIRHETVDKFLAPLLK